MKSNQEKGTLENPWNVTMKLPDKEVEGFKFALWIKKQGISNEMAFNLLDSSFTEKHQMIEGRAGILKTSQYLRQRNISVEQAVKLLEPYFDDEQTIQPNLDIRKAEAQGNEEE